MLSQESPPQTAKPTPTSFDLLRPRVPTKNVLTFSSVVDKRTARIVQVDAAIRKMQAEGGVDNREQKTLLWVNIGSKCNNKADNIRQVEFSYSLKNKTFSQHVGEDRYNVRRIPAFTTLNACAEFRVEKTKKKCVRFADNLTGKDWCPRSFMRLFSIALNAIYSQWIRVCNLNKQWTDFGRFTCPSANPAWYLHPSIQCCNSAKTHYSSSGDT